jgi:hypothetical protein
VWGLEEATAGNPGGGPVVEGPRTGVGGVCGKDTVTGLE